SSIFSTWKGCSWSRILRPSLCSSPALRSSLKGPKPTAFAEGAASINLPVASLDGVQLFVLPNCSTINLILNCPSFLTESPPKQFSVNHLASHPQITLKSLLLH